MPFDLYSGLGKPEEKKKIVIASGLDNIVFEPKVSRNSDGNKKFFSFNESLRALRERGYQRHPRPAEAFALICAGLKGKLKPEQQAVVDDMRSDYFGEWLSMAMKHEGNLLHCYLDPENIVFNAKKEQYVIDGNKLRHSDESVYSIGSLDGWVPIKELNEVNPSLVEFLWSRPYAILPEEIRQNAYLQIPMEGRRAVVLGVYGSGWFNLTANDGIFLGPSRGVVVKE